MLRLRNSLGARIAALTFLVTVVIFAGLFFATSAWQEDRLMDDLEKSAVRTSQLLQAAIEEPMRVGDNAGTIAQFERLRRTQPDIDIYLTNHQGNITYATRDETVREDLGAVLTNDELTVMLETGLQRDSETAGLMPVDGTPRFVEVKSIPNAEACHHCHGSSKAILGVMVTAQDVTDRIAALDRSQLMTGLIMLVGLGLLLGCLLVFMRLNVVKPIRSIAGTAKLMADGDLDANFKTKSQDEIGELSDSLSDMVLQIKNHLEYTDGILKGIIVPLFVTDTEGRLKFANLPLLNLLARREEDVLGKPLSGALAAAPGLITVAGEVISSARSKNGEERLLRHDGEEVPVHYEISPLHDAHDTLVGAIGVIIDLTQEEEDKMRIEEQRMNLMRVADQVTEVALRLNDAAQSISTQMEELSSGVEDTSDRTAQLATAMEEMNASVLEVARNASDTSEAASQARDAAHRGGEEMTSTVALTRDVAEASERLSTTLGGLSESVDDIGRILSVINEIADQTNLLALNAAIEAARAGDAGRGFAVVADEVRKLAEKTMQATAEVQKAIDQIQTATGEAVFEMDATREKVVTTSRKAEESGEMLQTIVSRSDGIAKMVSSIAVASEEQSTTSDEINTGVDTINQTSQEISRRIRETNEQTTGVADMAEELSRLVASFRQQGEQTQEQAAREERRRYQRFQTKVYGRERPVTIIAGQSRLQGQLVDICSGGMRVALGDPSRTPSEGTSLRIDTDLKYNGFALTGWTGEVRWSRDGQIGIEFGETLPLGNHEMQNMLARRRG